MTWPEPNGHEDEEFVPMAQRRTFRIVSALVTVIVVLAMLAITIGPYVLDRRNRPAQTTVTTGLPV